MISRLAQRFRVVVAMWVAVGLGGSVMVAVLGIMAVTGTGVFQDKAHVVVDAEFAPGQEVRTNTVRPGGVMVLASPETVDLGTVECTWKSRVYTTGEQDTGEVVIEAPDGVAPFVTSQGAAPRRFVAVGTVDWMSADYVRCSGADVETFALTSTKGITSDGFRYGAGAFMLLFSLVLAGLGLLALRLTRRWSRQTGSPAYPDPTYHRPAYPDPTYHQPVRPNPGHPPLPAGHNPYARPSDPGGPGQVT